MCCPWGRHWDSAIYSWTRCSNSGSEFGIWRLTDNASGNVRRYVPYPVPRRPDSQELFVALKANP